jgi:hypothetical protein
MTHVEQLQMYKLASMDKESGFLARGIGKGLNWAGKKLVSSGRQAGRKVYEQAKNVHNGNSLVAREITKSIAPTMGAGNARKAVGRSFARWGRGLEKRFAKPPVANNPAAGGQAAIGNVTDDMMAAGANRLENSARLSKGLSTGGAAVGGGLMGGAIAGVPAYIGGNASGQLEAKQKMEAQIAAQMQQLPSWKKFLFRMFAPEDFKPYIQ